MLSSLALEVTICEFYVYKSAAGLVSSAVVLTEELYFNGVRRAIVGTHESLFGVCAGIASCCVWQVAFICGSGAVACQNALLPRWQKGT